MASSSTVVEMPSVPKTMIEKTRCGKMCRVGMGRVDEPMARCTSMNSRWARLRVSVKITRAIWTQFIMPMTSATISREGLKMAASTIASSNAGKAIMRSVMRIRTPPIQPPKYPAVIPTVAPSTMAMPLASTPMMRDVWVPRIRGENRSLPRRSVPSQKREGGRKGPPSGLNPSNIWLFGS